MRDPIFFMQEYIKVQHPVKGLVPFILYDYQIDIVNLIHNNRKSILLCSRQLGKTITSAMYILWFTQFSAKKKCIIASKSMDHAVEIMSRIKVAYEELPSWLKAGCKFFNRTSIEFDNGSKIHCEATSERTGRGESPSILYIDEIAHVNRRIQTAMWASLTPALSTGGKFIITSTPNGDDDLFASLWRGANSGANSFAPLKVLWYQHPDRGQEYYEEMLAELGELKCRQEIDCVFLSSDPLLINSMKLMQLKQKQHVCEDLGFKFWKPPEELGGQGKTYLIGVDPATGSGKDFSVIEVFEFPSLEQVAEWRSNEINIPLFYAKLKWILDKLSQPQGRVRSDVIWTFERNGIGEAMSALYQNDEKQPQHADLYNDQPTTNKLGVFTAGKTKVLACLQLKSLVEKTTNGLVINSAVLLEELKNFAAKGGTYEAKSGSTDDAVMATILVVRLLKRLAEYNDDAFSRVNEYVAPDENDQFGDEPVPFLI